jgi:hypothetical protein
MDIMFLYQLWAKRIYARQRAFHTLRRQMDIAGVAIGIFMSLGRKQKLDGVLGSEKSQPGYRLRKQ